MLMSRHNFGIATIGKLIYAVSGYPTTQTCEVFDTKKNTWTMMAALFPYEMQGITLSTVKSRFIYAFGGVDF